MAVSPNTLWRHLKKGTLYEVTARAKDCTNARDGTPTVVYRSADDPSLVFVRDEAEFLTKFEPAQPPAGALDGRRFEHLVLKQMAAHQAGAFFRNLEENRSDYTDTIPFVSQTADAAALEARMRANLARQALGVGEFYLLFDGEDCAGYFLIREKDRSAGWAEIGYLLGRRWRGRGVATSVCRALIDEVFRQGFTKVLLCCNDDNQPSRAVAGRLGFTLEGVLKDFMAVAGRSRHLAWFGLAKADYQA